MRYIQLHSRPRLKLILSALLITASFLACGDDQPEVVNDGRALLMTQAFLPEQVAAGRIGVANAPVQIVDFQRTAAGEVTGTGFTDAEGNHTIEIASSRIIAVIVSGPVRVSGLTTATASDLISRDVLVKEFDGITDIACQAGVTALQDGSLSSQDLTKARIANLELGSAVVNATTVIDFFDPNSVTAAANLVRQITGDGSFPPQ